MILRTIFHLIGPSISHEYRHRGGSAAHDSFLCPNWLQSRPGSYSADPAVQKLAPFLQNRHRERGKHPCLVAIFRTAPVQKPSAVDQPHRHGLVEKI